MGPVISFTLLNIRVIINKIAASKVLTSTWLEAPLVGKNGKRLEPVDRTSALRFGTVLQRGFWTTHKQLGSIGLYLTVLVQLSTHG